MTSRNSQSKGDSKRPDNYNFVSFTSAGIEECSLGSVGSQKKEHGVGVRDVSRKTLEGEFPGSPVVRTPGFHCRGPRSIPGRVTRIPQAAPHGWGKKKERKKDSGEAVTPDSMLVDV